MSEPQTIPNSMNWYDSRDQACINSLCPTSLLKKVQYTVSNRKATGAKSPRETRIKLLRSLSQGHLGPR